MSKVVLKVCVRDEESIHKEKFVRDYLAPLLKAVNPHIVDGIVEPGEAKVILDEEKNKEMA